MPFVLKPTFATYVDWSDVRLGSRDRLKVTTEDQSAYYFQLTEFNFGARKSKRMVLDWELAPAAHLIELVAKCRQEKPDLTDQEIFETHRYELNGGHRTTWSRSSPELGNWLQTMLSVKGGGSGETLPGGRVTGIESVIVKRSRSHSK